MNSKTKKKEDNKVMKKFNVEITGCIEDFDKWNADYRVRNTLNNWSDILDYTIKLTEIK